MISIKNKLVTVLALLVSLIGFSQHHKVSSEIRTFGGVDTEYSSYVYSGDATQSNTIIKNELYSFFDTRINLNVEEFSQNESTSTSYINFIYRRTSRLNNTLTINSNSSNNEKFPMIQGEDSNLIAIVIYRIALNSKEVIFYSNKTPVDRYYFNQQESINADFRNNFHLDNM